MNMNALLAWVLGAVFGAVTYRFAVVWRERWRAVGAAALGTAVMIDLVTTPTISQTWHAIRFWLECALLAVFAVSFVMDSRARRGSRSRTPGGTA